MGPQLCYIVNDPMYNDIFDLLITSFTYMDFTRVLQAFNNYVRYAWISQVTHKKYYRRTTTPWLQTAFKT